MKYVALLRGINVGGKNMIPMVKLKESLEADGIINVRTYIQSGNILFESDERSTSKLATWFEKHILDVYGHTVPTLVISKTTFKEMMNNLPGGWGDNVERRYNTFFLLAPLTAKQAVEVIGPLKTDIESLVSTDIAILHLVEIASIGRSSTGRLFGTPAYKMMTVRNWNTTKKLLELLEG